MVHDSQGPHHHHTRKRVHHKLEPYPHPFPFKRFLDKAVYFVAVFSIVLTLPQLAKIWIDQSVAGVSVITWSTYLNVAFFWQLYGIVHNEKPIIFANTLWIVMDVMIIVGVLVH